MFSVPNVQCTKCLVYPALSVPNVQCTNVQCTQCLVYPVFSVPSVQCTQCWRSLRLVTMIFGSNDQLSDMKQNVKVDVQNEKPQLTLFDLVDKEFHLSYKAPVNRINNVIQIQSMKQNNVTMETKYTLHPSDLSGTLLRFTIKYLCCILCFWQEILQHVTFLVFRFFGFRLNMFHCNISTVQCEIVLSASLFYSMQFSHL